MNTREKYKELKHLIEEYLTGKSSYENLYSFAWEVILEAERNIQPPEESLQESERIFWYSIWQIQHLASKDHEEDGSLESSLIKLLEYLEFKEKLPKNYYGRSP